MAIDRRDVTIPPIGLAGILRVPAQPLGAVVFAHGSGSGRFSPRNNMVAEGLAAERIASLLFDLLTEGEENDRDNVFNISLLADRLIDAIGWVEAESDLADLPIGLFGASTGAAAALVAAARVGRRVAAVVSRGGRPDLADEALAHVRAPTLLIVGGADKSVLQMNRQALARMTAPKALEVVPGATHLFEEPGALDAVVALAAHWFVDRLANAGKAET